MKKNPIKSLARKMQTEEERGSKKSVYDSKAWQERKLEKALKVKKIEEEAQKRREAREKIKQQNIKKTLKLQKK